MKKELKWKIFYYKTKHTGKYTMEIYNIIVGHTHNKNILQYKVIKQKKHQASRTYFYSNITYFTFESWMQDYIIHTYIGTVSRPPHQTTQITSPQIQNTTPYLWLNNLTWDIIHMVQDTLFVYLTYGSNLYDTWLGSLAITHNLVGQLLYLERVSLPY